ncbi:MAG TPA: electron transfer flavoprotein subunit beta/FixA family protein [Phycisphaerae bacterium]|nr:electron transfer flavoprotein subunit beta/FixA family protein [Phycisphaerae bacterium]HOI54843.1 electron transfer flavoprotein subunit beta/FixA family protein [Phycisphaerae bacterium]
MSFDSVVLIKQVPDTARVTGKAMNDDGTVNRSALPAIFNPEDLYALEAALEVKQRHGGTVTAITMGPPPACEVLRDALYMGADRVILLTDRRAAASDTLATSYILSCAVRTVGKVDLVFCGRQAIDGDTAQVGPQCAEKLGLPQITYLEEIVAINGRQIVARRNIGNGYEVVECAMPVLLTVTDTFQEPRPYAAKAMLKCKHARSRLELEREAAQSMPGSDEKARAAAVDQKAAELKRRGLLIEQWTLDDIHADLAWCGRDGSPTKVKRIQSVVLKGSGHEQYQPTEGDISRLVHQLIEDHTIG